MPRVKRGVTSHARHKKLLNLTKGHRASSHKLVRRATESMLHALSYEYRHRKERKGDMRRLWIARINAAARLADISYSQLMNGLKKAGVTLDRKSLADMAIRDAAGFARLAGVAREAQQAGATA